ncbi:MAG: family 43 glycosylhydrolase [Rikenellaceae bacterium]
MKLKLTILAIVASIGSVVAENPFITHIFTADPTARVHDGKLFVYPSCDIVPEGAKSDKPGFYMPGYHIFSLENGNTWKDYGWLAKEADIEWTKKGADAMWAPDCIEKDGKYYYFFPARCKEFKQRIGMGVSDSPTGPFKWQPTYMKDVMGIDPGLLLDDDNQAYMFFGSGDYLQVAPLSDDMTKVAKKPIQVEGLPTGFKEGAFPFKRNGLYYLTFAHIFNEEGFTLGYATSDKPMGPYRYQGKIMDNIGDGTNHHSVVKYKDQWILFYHNWAISGMRKLRSICADYMEFNKNGTIKKVKPTLRGIGYPTLRDTIQIDRYSEISGAQTAFVSGGEPAGWMICEAANKSHVNFTNVDFADGSATKMVARMASGQRLGKIEVRKGNLTGDIIATFPIKHTGDWDSWVTVESDIQTKLTGLNDLCVLFTSENGSTKTANLNWLIIK